MAKFYDALSSEHIDFIKEQHIFFVGSAPLSADGHVNCSPKGLDSFRVLSGKRVAYMDIISSGNETSAHMLENGRVTFMFCSFGDKPLILRLYGRGYTVLPGDPQWQELSPLFNMLPSTRQLIVADIGKVQSSCGFGVPMFDYASERDQHHKWAASKGKEGLIAYRQKNNLLSMDGLPTPLSMDQP